MHTTQTSQDRRTDDAILVLGIYTDFGAGVLAADDPRFHPDFTFEGAGRRNGLPDPGRGAASFVRFCRAQLDLTGLSWIPRPQATLVGDGRVAVMVQVDATRSGVPRTFELVHVWTVQDGLAVHCHSFVDDQTEYDRFNAAPGTSPYDAPARLPAAPLGVHHIGLTVSDLDAATEWFSRVLGLEPLGPPDTAPNGLSRRVRIGRPGWTPGIGLVQHLAPEPGAFDERRPGLDHLALAIPVDEVDRWVEWLDRHGVEHGAVAPSPVVAGASVLVARGPDRLQVELFAAPGA